MKKIRWCQEAHKKIRKKRKFDKKETEDLVGPEYLGEGAMNNIFIAGSTDIQEENKNFLS